MIFPVGAVSGRIVGQVGDGRQCVGEMKIARSNDEVVIGLRKDKLFISTLAIDEQPVDAWCAQIARRIVFTAHARCKDAVGIHV